MLVVVRVLLLVVVRGHAGLRVELLLLLLLLLELRRFQSRC